MSYNPKESLENTINTLGTRLWVHLIARWFGAGKKCTKLGFLKKTICSSFGLIFYPFSSPPELVNRCQPSLFQTHRLYINPISDMNPRRNLSPWKKMLGDWPLNNVPLKSLKYCTHYELQSSTEKKKMNQFTARDDHFHGSTNWFHHISRSWIETSAVIPKNSLPPKFGRAFLRWWQDEILPGGFCVRLISRKGKDDKTIIKHGLYGLYGLYSINQNFLK